MMSVKLLTVTFLIFFTNNVLADSQEEYLDTVINMLLNGESLEVQDTDENEQEQNLVLIGGIWKCGKCADVDDSQLVYSEINEIDTEITDDDQPIEVQISLSIPSMTCVAVVGERAGMVKHVTGACAGDRVAISVVAANRFTVNVYADSAH